MIITAAALKGASHMASTLQTLSKHFLNPALEKVLEGRRELIQVLQTQREKQS